MRKHASFLHAEAAAAEAAATGLGLGPSSSHPGIPLSRCLDKFTENEVSTTQHNTTQHNTKPYGPTDYIFSHTLLLHPINK